MQRDGLLSILAFVGAVVAIGWFFTREDNTKAAAQRPAAPVVIPHSQVIGDLPLPNGDGHAYIISLPSGDTGDTLRCVAVVSSHGAASVDCIDADAPPTFEPER